MKKIIWPRGYTINYTNLIGSVILYIALLLFFLFSGVRNNQKDLLEFKKFAFVVIILNTLWLCVEIYRIYKRYIKRKGIQLIIKNATYSINGTMQNIEKELIDYKGNKVYEPPNVVYVESVDTVYYILVTYSDPIDRCQRIVKSALYLNNPTHFLKNSEIMVYITPNTQPLVVIYKQNIVNGLMYN